MNKSLLDTDILSKVLKGIDLTVASNAAATAEGLTVEDPNLHP